MTELLDPDFRRGDVSYPRYSGPGLHRGKLRPESRGKKGRLLFFMGKSAKKDFYSLIEAICVKDSRYKPDSYGFVIHALHWTQARLKKQAHISGKELSQGLRDFAIEQYGPMARTVLKHWGITKTGDFGNIVFNMISKKLLAKTDEDSIDDFKEVYSFDAAFDYAKILADSKTTL